MKWKSVPEANRQAFDAALPEEPDIERRSMFGCPAAFVNGNLFAGAHQNRINLRLDEPTRAACLADGFDPFEPMEGKPMREYVCPPEARSADVQFLMPWLRKAYEYGRGLPPKPAKKKAARTKSR